MRLPWEYHDQSQETNWRHCVTGPELPFFHRKKIDHSVKIPWHRLSKGIACSYSSAPVIHCQPSNAMCFKKEGIANFMWKVHYTPAICTCTKFSQNYNWHLSSQFGTEKHLFPFQSSVHPFLIPKLAVRLEFQVLNSRCSGFLKWPGPNYYLDSNSQFPQAYFFWNPKSRFSSKEWMQYGQNSLYSILTNLDQA